MANWDRPSFSWPADTGENLDGQRIDVMTPPAMNPNIDFVVAMQQGGGTPTTPEGDPIYGYGWGLSG